MTRFLLIAIILILSNFQISWAVDKVPAFTQKDLALLIVQQFSLSDGLPKEPVDRDYLVILGGKRTYRYEAESAYNSATDRVSVKEFPLYGDFTGLGWLSGVSDTTTATFTIMLPIAGEYDLKAVVKGNGFIWNISDKEYPYDHKSKVFREANIAKLSLKAGTIVIKVTIPPDGAIDSIILSAPNNPPIQPFVGWRFKEALTAAHMAEIVVALTNRHAGLPDAEPEAAHKIFNVSEMITLPPEASLTKADYLGAFSSSSWVRADFRGTTLQIPFAVTEKGYYVISANILGEPLSGSINDNIFKLAGTPYLSKTVLGMERLEAGVSRLLVTLPPLGGIDSIQLTRKSTTPEDFLRLSGVPGPAGRLVDAGEAAALLKTNQGVFLNIK